MTNAHRIKLVKCSCEHVCLLLLFSSSLYRKVGFTGLYQGILNFDQKSLWTSLKTFLQNKDINAVLLGGSKIMLLEIRYNLYNLQTSVIKL